MRDVLTTMDGLARSSWFARNDRRRMVFAVIALLLAILCVFPRHYLAVVVLSPQNSDTSGLSSILSQIGGNYAALLGNHQPIEVDITIAKSYQVETEAASILGLTSPGDSPSGAARAIARKVDLRALRGSILQIEATGWNADSTLKLAEAYSQALQHRLGQLSLAQTQYKHAVLDERMGEASGRLSKAEAAMDAFRVKHQLPAPDVQLGAAVSQMTQLQSDLLAKQVELQTALHFNTADNPQIKAIQADINTLEKQLDDAKTRAPNPNGLTATGIAAISNEYDDLARELQFSQALYDSYTRYLEGVAIEQLTSVYNMQEIQPPYLDPYYQFNLPAVFALLMLLIFAVASEFYLLRPPISRRSPV